MPYGIRGLVLKDDSTQSNSGKGKSNRERMFDNGHNCGIVVINGTGHRTNVNVY